MYEYISGNIAKLTPTYVVIETCGIGYYINISLQTYTKLDGCNNAKILLHQIVREDAHLLFGFFDEDEREMFRLLMTVTGVGANTARMMLSSLSSTDIAAAIMKEDIVCLKSVKGIGLKTAQRIIVDLKDKVTKVGIESNSVSNTSNTLKEEAFAALLALGFAKPAIEKVLTALLKENKNLSIEALIKAALKQL